MATADSSFPSGRLERSLEVSAARLPDKTALVVAQERWSYRRLNESANRFAHALLGLGLQRDDRVVIFMGSSAEAAVAVYGTLRAGGVFSVLHPTTKAPKLGYVLNNCRAAVLVTEAPLLPVAEEARVMAPSLRATLVSGAPPSPDGCLAMEEALEAQPARPPAIPATDMDLASLLYTSGSTGLPKGVMMTHRNMVAAAASITSYLDNTRDDVILSCLPLSFDYGLYQVLMGVGMGATVVLERSFAFPQLLLRRAREERATGLPLVPTLVALLLRMTSLTPGSLPGLRYITSTAAALPPAHLQRLQELFPQARIYSMYGLTECKRCTYLPPEQLTLRPESVGKAIPNTEAYVVDESGAPVGPGVVGELVVRGPHVMQGYWEDPQATARALRPGRYPWERVLYTGDLFRADGEGYLYFVGRKDDIIKSRGEKVSPKEVEAVLASLPGVAEAVVVGVPDAILGAAVKAVLVPAPGARLSEREVLRHCAERLEDFMVPRQVEFREELPRTTNGKVDRAALRAAPPGAGRDGTP